MWQKWIWKKKRHLNQEWLFQFRYKKCDEKFVFNFWQVLEHLLLHDNLNIDQLSPLIILRNDWIVEKVQRKPNHEIEAINNLKAILLKVFRRPKLSSDKNFRLWTVVRVMPGMGRTTFLAPGGWLFQIFRHVSYIKAF